jgi:hypothetical protein
MPLHFSRARGCPQTSQLGARVPYSFQQCLRGSLLRSTAAPQVRGAETRVLCVAAKQCSNILLFMSNRTRRILFISPQVRGAEAAAPERPGARAARERGAGARASGGGGRAADGAHPGGCNGQKDGRGRGSWRRRGGLVAGGQQPPAAGGVAKAGSSRPGSGSAFVSFLACFYFVSYFA